jgi:ABC-type phosphate transport system permease subunit
MLELLANAAFILGIWLIVAVPTGMLIGTFMNEMGGKDDV